MKKPKAMRIIEVMICESNGGSDCGSWATDYVNIPAKTRMKNIEKEAVKAAYAQLGLAERDNIVHVALYHIPEPERNVVVCRLCSAVGECDDDGWVEVKGGFICEDCMMPDSHRRS